MYFQHPLLAEQQPASRQRGLEGNCPTPAWLWAVVTISHYEAYAKQGPSGTCLWEHSASWDPPALLQLNRPLQLNPQ